MLCAVYKSSRKADTYLFVNKRDCFDDVPEALMQVFGVPQLVMVFPIAKRESLGIADIVKVRAALEDQGYYLQIPPPQVNLLSEHKQSLGIKD
ncbi:YcgL domain-containing protein [Shewanella acanthi]|uniref:YcgL domain-containing protein n=1 Tax=Shewanella acanthi TaxID=2864212 RepID=UPI001C658FFD|nr:YcgL domain-containing protein [Shewanella acanthi]QYJ77483.1 YcgL domain-containing protein [Shewanella acanthi]